jgi:hypothetical protein
VNILLDGKPSHKLLAFDLSFYTNGHREDYTSSWNRNSKWLAPEIHRHGLGAFPTGKSDIYVYIRLLWPALKYVRLVRFQQVALTESSKIYTNNDPFPDKDGSSIGFSKEVAAGAQPASSLLPGRPRGEGKTLLSLAAWAIIRAFWDHNPATQPMVSTLESKLQEIGIPSNNNLLDLAVALSKVQYVSWYLARPPMGS